jgi:hypothetical protein
MADTDEPTEAATPAPAAVVAQLWFDLDDPSTEGIARFAPELAAALDALVVEQLESDAPDVPEGPRSAMQVRALAQPAGGALLGRLDVQLHRQARVLPSAAPRVEPGASCSDDRTLRSTCARVRCGGPVDGAGPPDRPTG